MRATELGWWRALKGLVKMLLRVQALGVFSNGGCVPWCAGKDSPSRTGPMGKEPKEPLEGLGAEFGSSWHPVGC